MRIGFFLSCEEYGPRELVAQARLAERAGFHGLWISDHYHPWTEAQGESPFVWTVIGALAEATEGIPVATAVTCPTVRTHPAVIAQAGGHGRPPCSRAASRSASAPARLNEHILGDHWPEAEVRIEMLEEAIEVIRKLWTGETVSHRGRHYRVENARIYTRPAESPPILVSGFGPKSVALAARVGDGYVTTMPDAGLIARFRDGGGGDKLVQAGTKVSYGADEAEQRRIAHRIWPNEGLTGELAQVLPAHFEQASQLVTEEMIGEAIPCGPDLERQVEAFLQFADAGVDELYVAQIGGNHEAFFEAYERDVLPRFH